MGSKHSRTWWQTLLWGLGYQLQEEMASGRLISYWGNQQRDMPLHAPLISYWNNHQLGLGQVCRNVSSVTRVQMKLAPRVVWTYKASTLSSEGCPADSASVKEAASLKLALREHVLLHLLFTKCSLISVTGTSSHCHHPSALARWGRGCSGYMLIGASNTKSSCIQNPWAPTPVAPGALLSA